MSPPSSCNSCSGKGPGLMTDIKPAAEATPDDTRSDGLHPRAAAERQLHDRHMAEADFDRAHFTIAWELTRACAYACVHCRADAQHRRDPRELTTDEGYRLIDRFV